MAINVILHLTGEEPILAEMDQEPQPGDAFIRVSNMRKRDGKDLAYLSDGVESVLFPWHRVTFLELMRDEAAQESVIDFYRV